MEYTLVVMSANIVGSTHDCVVASRVKFWIMPYTDTAKDESINKATVVCHSAFPFIILDTSTNESVNTRYIANTGMLDVGFMLDRALNPAKTRNVRITTPKEDGL